METAPLATQEDRVLELLARSPADATILSWIEGETGELAESSRTRKASLVPRCAIEITVRWNGRTGRAVFGSGDWSDLEAGLRQAMASASAQPPSPDWNLTALEKPLEVPTSLCDPLLWEWNPQRARSLLAPWMQPGTSVKLRWSALRVLVATSFWGIQKAELTGLTAEVRKGPRPGSGFALRSARTFRELALEELMEKAAHRQANQTEAFEAQESLPLVLASDCAVVLLEALGRLALSSESQPIGEGEDLRWSPSLELIDDPTSSPGVPLSFDAEGLGRRGSLAVHRGKRALRALDLDTAAREGSQATGHALGGGHAWPIHLAFASPGGLEEEELLAQASGGLRIGSLENLSLEPWPPYRFLARARSVRRITPDGRLGAAVGPLLWESSLSEVFGSLRAWGRQFTAWSHPSVEALGAVRCPSLALEPSGRFREDPQF
jgi:predicted Zn-dependent protease